MSQEYCSRGNEGRVKSGGKGATGRGRSSLLATKAPWTCRTLFLHFILIFFGLAPEVSPSLLHAGFASSRGASSRGAYRSDMVLLRRDDMLRARFALRCSASAALLRIGVKFQLRALALHLNPL